ncbi:NADPH-dependent ferric siderophore reductase, contains FAD-binding and SIP domains [Actinopolyspora alba]|uniref:NADPH-dependent ferric siderophore reductase, contains FAD-binding and SIP domains n=1 Tax=Actinopolyspora alba TaxID=673379 RepID=A0A1I2AT79_9ACTN|nr:siderophore-interacting protein [Actinopolyspora alba]SFE47205.1 NADPH-dependent ferric siderophore reductase, contains FAD-binding and SIP domains [Actinopolyspora alba]
MATATGTVSAAAPASTRSEATARPESRVYTVEVAGRQRLSPNFVRLTFSGEGLRSFGAGGVDQRIKLMLPRPGRTVADVPDGHDWYPTWQAMPEEIRPTMRTYTVRSFRPERAEMDIDFVLHGSGEEASGPASAWASGARIGDRVAILGPDRPGSGRMWGCEWCPPATARRLLLAGDETAIPAVAAILESLPADSRGIACLEVPSEADIQAWEHVPRGVEIRWLPRDIAGSEHGELLEQALETALGELCAGPKVDGCPAASEAIAALEDVDVDNYLLWEIPGSQHQDPAYDESLDIANGELYGWLAGEAGVIKRLRRMTVQGYGVPRGSVAFMGYWRQGRC